MTGFDSLAIRFAWVLTPLLAIPAQGQQEQPPVYAGEEVEAGISPGDLQDAEIVSYEPVFFQPYNPVTALDMVQQVPGFRVDEGGDSRGFGGAAGNLLINDRRPSTKSDSAGDILARIPASQVSRIELIRGQTGGLALRGQTIVVNVILAEDGTNAFAWETSARKFTTSDSIIPSASASMRGLWGGTQYTLGIERDTFSQRAMGLEQVSNLEGVLENRLERADEKERSLGVNVNTEGNYGNALTHIYVRAEREHSDEFEESRRQPVTANTAGQVVLEGADRETESLEAGADIEFPLRADLTAKLIGLHNRDDRDRDADLRRQDAAQQLTFASRALRQTRETETIARVEFDWTGIRGHHVELNIERAENDLVNALRLFEDRGLGPVEVALEGANTEVREERWDVEVTHNWERNGLAVDSGLAAEASTITQQGDAARERDFSFVKPRLMLTWSPSSTRQTRLRLQREVAQLNFNDFVSATNFGDNQFAFGNPELKPQSTWAMELAHERRFGGIGVIALTGFHHWVDDVQDLLPLEGIAEIPGNIGDATRWGFEVEATLPLDVIGLSDGRLDIQGRWQDSAVDDPVTGNTRILSNERRYDLRLELRQNIQGGLYAWGAMVAVESETPFFGIDETVATDNIDEVVDMDIFVETTRWFGVRTQLKFGNIFNRNFSRDRRVYEGERGLTPLAFRELRNRNRGSSVLLSVTGNF